MVDVRDQYGEFQGIPADVVAVSMGTVSQVAHFRRRLGLPFLCLADPSRIAYQSYHIPVGSLNQIAGTSIWKAGWRALFSGGVGIPQGDVYQMHGAFVIDRKGIVRLAHRPLNSADRVSNSRLLDCLRSVNCELD